MRERIFVREVELGSSFGAPERVLKVQPGGKIRGAVGNTLGPPGNGFGVPGNDFGPPDDDFGSPGNDFGPPVGKKTKFSQGSVAEESRACHTR